jgi:hypothetical protein
MRYKVLSRDNRELAEFNTAQSVADYLFTLPIASIRVLYTAPVKASWVRL